MSALEKPLKAVKTGLQAESMDKNPVDSIAERRSKELVIAFAGPIGCGIHGVKERVVSLLRSSGYEVLDIKISDYLRECIKKKVVKVEGTGGSKGAERYIQMQEAGNQLRARQADLLAEYAIQRIAQFRGEKVSPQTELTDFVPQRTAYLIDQLKHPKEVELLRLIYGNLFYLFGVLSSSPRREARLREEGIKPARISDLIERDRKQVESHGQQLDKTLQLADFFVRNDNSNSESLERKLRRFIDLIHGVNGITPTQEEHGMYVAYTSSFRSACLSRQVGASIMSPEGTIIAIGRNDVPRPGGGLYGPECGEDDARCVKLENDCCHNDMHKKKLTFDIANVIRKEIGDYIDALKREIETPSVLDAIDISALAQTAALSAQENTRLGGLIEFSRSIHAEMDAIVSVARRGGSATKDASLFTYTFPCHNCARHIVAAGIKTVYFLEPYEKSLALELHADAIALDGVGSATQSAEVGPKVKFLHFEGVAPKQYLNMFKAGTERKDGEGRAIKINVREADKKVPEYLDEYRDYELKVVKHLTNLMASWDEKSA